jgi:23S rRNA (cytidine1920-2'-O)/16S rRNA (cytidine1409-2'-O)-methyltransferase
MKDRVDKVLVQMSLVSTRSQASQLVKEGVVFYQNKKVKKPSFLVDENDLEVRKDTLFVGRGAHKIEGALNDFSVSVEGLSIADVGACTGGFTDYVLKNGASHVIAIDVGHDQLAQSLRNDSRVENFEGVNIKHPFEIENLVDLAVVDLSYISLKLTLKNISNLVKESGKIIALVKPQFEVGKENIGKGGIVKNDEVRINSVKSLYEWCSKNKLYISGAIVSPIKGKTGNIEYFFCFDKQLDSHQFKIEELESL